MLKLAGELIEGQLADHIARLDAHTYEAFSILRTGGYYTGYGSMAHVTNIALTANRLYCVPFVVPRDITIDRIAIHVYSAGAGGTKARLGIYNDGTNLHPGTLLADLGTVDVDGTGIKAITIDPAQALTKGLYWLALISDGTPSLKGTADTSVTFNILGLNPAGFHYCYPFWQRSSTYNSLSDPCPAMTVASTGADLPAILARVASLD